MIWNIALVSISSFPSSLERGKDDLWTYVQRRPRAIVPIRTYVVLAIREVSSGIHTVLYTTVNTQTTQYTEAAGSAVHHSLYHICPVWHKCPVWRPHICLEVRK